MTMLHKGLNKKNSELYLGIVSKLECPNCGEMLMVNVMGDKWCTKSDCAWSNNPSLTKLMKKLKKNTKVRDWV